MVAFAVPGATGQDGSIALQGFGFFNQHDGNIVADFVEKLAVVADQSILSGIEVDVAFALGTGEDVEQFFA
jgi:hypothetical protein